MNDPFGLPRKLRLFGGERIGQSFAGLGRSDHIEPAEKAGETDRTHAHPAAAEEVATRERKMFQIRFMMHKSMPSIRMDGRHGAEIRLKGFA